MKRLAAVLLAVAPLAHGIANGVVPDVTDYSLDAVAAFGNASGLIEGHEWFCSAVLIRPGVALTAKHCAWALTDGGAVRFRRNPDGSLGDPNGRPDTYYNVSVSSIYIQLGGDSAVLYLSDPVDHIVPIPAAFAPELPLNVETCLAGWGMGGPAQGEGERALRNCSSWLTFANSQLIYFPTAWETPGPGCVPNNNDSGGPVLRLPVGDGAPLAVVGVINFPNSATAIAQFADDPNYNGGLSLRHRFTRR